MTATDEAMLAAGEYLSVSYHVTDAEGAAWIPATVAVVVHPDTAGRDPIDWTALATFSDGLIELTATGADTAALVPGAWRVHTWAGTDAVADAFIGDLALRVSPGYIGVAP